MPSHLTKSDHSPRYRFDCGRCKFSWNCGYVCACALNKKYFDDPPEYIKEKVNNERINENCTPEF